MRARSRPRRTDLVLAATMAALLLTLLRTGVAAAETTHEANQAAAMIAAGGPSSLTAAAVLALVTDTNGALAFEIAEDGTHGVWAGSAMFPDGRPAPAAPFFTQGYIYPVGTLTAAADGVNADGSPQFPDKVLGAWSCYGWSTSGSDQGARNPWILATQVYQFGGEWGAATLVSEGYVPASAGTPVDRAITGGTGPFALMRGDVRATPLGVNETAGINVRYEVRLWRP